MNTAAKDSPATSTQPADQCDTASDAPSVMHPTCATGGSNLHHPFQLIFGRNVRDTSPTSRTVTLANLFKEFEAPDTMRGRLGKIEYHALRKEVPREKAIRDRERDGAYLMAVVFRTPGTRSNEHISHMTCFVGDFDSGKTNGQTLRERLAGITYIAYTSYSHTATAPRWRVIVPYNAPVDVHEHERIFDHFNALFDGDLDPNCKKPAQVYYTPACPFDAVDEYEMLVQDGGLFDPSKALVPKLLSGNLRLVAPEAPPKATLNGLTPPHALARVARALEYVDSDDRDQWIRCGLALHHDFPSDRDTAYMIWEEWSKSSTKFDPTEARRTWAGFKTRQTGPIVTSGTILHLAREAGWQDPEGQPDWLHEMNERFFVARMGNRTLVFEEARHPVTEALELKKMSTPDFNTWLANRTVAHHDANSGGGVKMLPLASVWLKHPARRQYEGVVLAPRRETPGYYNLWRGLATLPLSSPLWRKSGHRIRWHLYKVICNGNRRYYRYLLDWLAFAVQQPDRPAEVAVVLRGGRGTGKGTFGEILRAIFGLHYLQISHGAHLTGNFNAHLMSCLMLFVDEAYWAGDKKAESVLKSLITEPTIAIEGKGVDLISAPNMLHVVMASNNDWVVPAGADERRFFVLDVSDCKAQDHAWFLELRAEMGKDGVAALVRMLEERNVSKVNLRAVPSTKALIDQKLLSLDTFDQWWYERLKFGDTERPGLAPQHGLLASRGLVWTDPVETKHAFHDYLTFAKAVNDRYPGNLTNFGLKLAKMLPTNSLKRIRMAAPPGSKSRPWGYQFPALSRCRRHFEAQLKLGRFDWSKAP